MRLPLVRVRAGVYQQQGNCLSTLRLGVLLSFFGMILIYLLHDIFDAPLQPLCFPFLFYMLLSSIRTVLIKAVYSIMLH